MNMKNYLAEGLGTAFLLAAVVGSGIIGVWAAHMMFDLSVLQIASKPRISVGQGISEVIATFGLLMVIFGGIRYRPDSVAMLVGMYITAGYWFTATSGFANPALTIARTLTDTFTAISPASAVLFIVCQLIGLVAALGCAKLLFNAEET